MWRKSHWSRGLKTKVQVWPFHCYPPPRTPNPRRHGRGSAFVLCPEGLGGLSQRPRSDSDVHFCNFAFSWWVIRGFALCHQAHSSSASLHGVWTVPPDRDWTSVLSHVGNCPLSFLSRCAPSTPNASPHSCLPWGFQTWSMGVWVETSVCFPGNGLWKLLVIESEALCMWLLVFGFL